MCGAQIEKLRMQLAVPFSVRVTDGGPRVEVKGMNEAVQVDAFSVAGMMQHVQGNVQKTGFIWTFSSRRKGVHHPLGCGPGSRQAIGRLGTETAAESPKQVRRELSDGLGGL